MPAIETRVVERELQAVCAMGVVDSYARIRAPSSAPRWSHRLWVLTLHDGSRVEFEVGRLLAFCLGARATAAVLDGEHGR